MNTDKSKWVLIFGALAVIIVALLIAFNTINDSNSEDSATHGNLDYITNVVYELTTTTTVIPTTTTTTVQEITTTTTTSTTAPPTTTVPPTTTPPTTAAPQATTGGSCVIPDYICQRESGHEGYSALNESSGAGGMYQFMPSTWNAVAAEIAPEWIGTPPHLAPPAVQDQFAAYLWDGGNGCYHWSTC